MSGFFAYAKRPKDGKRALDMARQNSAIGCETDFASIAIAEKTKKAALIRSGYKRLNPEVCPKTGTLGGFRCKVSNIFAKFANHIKLKITTYLNN